MIHKLQEKKERVKVSDISDTLKLAKTGGDKNGQGNGKKGYLTKYASEEDGRITYVFITEKGEELSDKYDKNYYSRLLKYMDHISEEEADCMISTIEKFYKVMSERRVDIE
ncbi:MAG: MarR family winged helix-turn-helix transcriptional regulator [Roseburia inulinivorans]